jgi:lipopolysaccharide biosynthesis glycosyltransferase
MKKAIVTSFDDNYMSYSRVAIKTLGQNYSGEEKLDVICLVPESLMGLEERYSNSIAQENLNIKFKTSEKFLDLLNSGYAKDVQYISANSYQRVFIGSILPDYDRVIYIDPDTIILRDINPLLEYKSRSPFLAVVETVNSGKTVFNNDDFPHFNAGVFIADLNFWRSKNIESKLVRWISKNPDSKYAEQDSLNAILIEHLAPLPFSFNFFEWTIENNELMSKEFCNPLIVHFTGGEKPWGDRIISKYGDLWRETYASLPIF